MLTTMKNGGVYNTKNGIVVVLEIKTNLGGMKTARLLCADGFVDHWCIDVCCRSMYKEIQ